VITVWTQFSIRRYLVAFLKYSRSNCESAEILVFWGPIFWRRTLKFLTEILYICAYIEHVTIDRTTSEIKRWKTKRSSRSKRERQNISGQQSCRKAIKSLNIWWIITKACCVPLYDSQTTVQCTSLTVILADVMSVVSPVVWVDSNLLVVYTNSRTPGCVVQEIWWHQS